MLLHLKEVDRFTDNEDIRQRLISLFEDVSSQDSSYSYEQFLNDGHFSEDDFILNTDTGECINGKEYFKRIMENDQKQK